MQQRHNKEQKNTGGWLIGRKVLSHVATNITTFTRRKCTRVYTPTKLVRIGINSDNHLRTQLKRQKNVWRPQLPATIPASSSMPTSFLLSFRICCWRKSKHIWNSALASTPTLRMASRRQCGTVVLPLVWASKKTPPARILDSSCGRNIATKDLRVLLNSRTVQRTFLSPPSSPVLPQLHGLRLQHQHPKMRRLMRPWLSLLKTLHSWLSFFNSRPKRILNLRSS